MLAWGAVALPGAARGQAAEATAAAPTAQDRETARQLWKLARERRDAGDGYGALQAALGAERLVPAPTTSLEVGRAHLALGKLIEARDAFLRVARYRALTDDPAPFVSARAEALELAAEIEGRIASVEVDVVTAEGRLADDAPLRLRIDEVEIDGPLARLPRSVNPGRRTVTASAPGYEPRSATLDLKEGERRRITLALARAGAVAAPPAARAAPAEPPVPPPPVTPPPSVEPERGGGVPPLAWVGLAIGGGGLVAAGVTGGLSLAATSDAEEECSAGLCAPGAEEDLDRARLLSEIANAGVGAGAAGIGLGLVAWLAPGPPVTDGGPAPVVWAGFGVAAAGLAAGAVTGALSLASASDAEALCTDRARCPSDAMDAESRARTLAGLSTAAFAAGVVGAGMGVAGLFLGDRRARSEARVAARIAPGYAGVRGSW
jgi:hypothetical protein